ncbi:MAG TPA: UDP-glucose 4-epimerase, partial [Patescibacteria group bacterium]|nr:UDP-glucose 4-epimerase [Patescibacteria group bacterium]
SQSDDLGDFYRLKTRGNLDYDQYFSKGSVVGVTADYTSDTTKQLNVKETVRLLRKLPFIKQALK